MLDLIDMVRRGELPPPPIATLIGFSIASIEPGLAVMEMEAGRTGDVHDDKDRLVARASSTCMTLRGAQAAGR